MSRSTLFRPGVRAGALVAAALATAVGSLGVAIAAPSAHHAKAASLVPLSQVGLGWSIAEYSAASVPMAPHKFKGPTTLYAVNPKGAKFAFYSWPANSPAANPGSFASYHVVDWSGDGQRVLVENSFNNLEQISLATGKVINKFKLPNDATAIGYTRPDGLNVLALIGNGVGRYDLTGKLTKMLAKAGNTAIDSPDGTQVIVNADNGLRVFSNAGGLVRTLHAPIAVLGCQPVRWWDKTTVLGVCSAKHGNFEDRLWLFPVNGGRVRALTGQRDGRGEDQGDVDAWNLTEGTYLQALGPCGVVYIAKQWASGQSHAVPIPGVSYPSDLIITGHGASLLVDANQGCQGGATLVWFNPGNNKVVRVFAPTPKNAYGVLVAVPFGRPVS